jgi:hypothetical protein
MQPGHLAHVTDLRTVRVASLQQLDDIGCFLLDFVLGGLRGRVETREQVLVAGSAVGETRGGVHGRAEAFVLRQPPEIQPFEPGANEPQTGIDQCA